MIAVVTGTVLILEFDYKSMYTSSKLFTGWTSTTPISTSTFVLSFLNSTFHHAHRGTNFWVTYKIGKDGTVFSYGNSFYTGDVPDSNPLTKREHKDSITALNAASSVLQLGLTTEGASAVATDQTETYTITGTSGAVSDPEARLVYFVKGDGTLALAWRVETDISSDWLLSYVDAESTTDIHGVINYVSSAVNVDASYLV